MKPTKPIVPEPRLIVAESEYEKYCDYIRLCSNEFGMYGYVTLDVSDTHPKFIVDTLFLAPQEVSGSAVDYETEGFEYAIKKATEDDRLNDLRFSCHSHVNMNAFWSGTDQNFIDQMNNGMVPWHVSLVQNKNDEYRARADFYNVEVSGDLQHFIPSNTHTVDLKLYIEGKENNDEERKAELAKFVKPAWKVKQEAAKKKGKASGGTHQPRKDWVNTSVEKDIWGDNEPDFVASPDNLDDWEWNPMYGWVKYEDDDKWIIRSIFDGKDEIMVFISNEPPINGKTTKDRESEDRAYMDALVESVMERNQD